MTSTGHISLFVGAGLAPPGVNPGTFFLLPGDHDLPRKPRLRPEGTTSVVPQAAPQSGF